MEAFRFSDFKKEWNLFRQSAEYKDVSDTMKEAGIKMPYRNNILWLVFTCGWNAANKQVQE